MQRELSEYKRIIKLSLKKCDGKTLQTLTKTDIRVLAGKTGLNNTRLQTLVKTLLLNRKTKISSEFMFALLLKNKNAAISSLALQSEAVLMNTLQRAIDKNIISETSSANITEFITALREAAATDALQIRIAGTYNIRQLLILASLNSNERKVFVTAFLKTKSTGIKLWEKLKSENYFSDRKLIKLQEIFILFKLSAGNINMLKLIMKYKKDKANLSGFFHYKKKDWQELIEKNKIDIPPCIPGNSDEDKKSNYAKSIYSYFKKDSKINK